MKTVFTPTEAAKICQTSTTVIYKCFDSGRLRGWRVPGSRFRRIPRDALKQFMMDHGIPLDNLPGDTVSILLIRTDVTLYHDLKDLLPKYQVHWTDTFFTAGNMITSVQPSCSVLDAELEAAAACQAAHVMQQQYPHTIRVGLLARQQQTQNSLFTDIFYKPFDPALLAQTIRTLITDGASA